MTKLARLPFGIGSLPHVDPKKACDAILSAFPDSPFCPELPRRDWRESMGIEQAAGLPGFRLDDEMKRIYFDSSEEISSLLGNFYEDFLSNNVSKYAVSDRITPGLNAMINGINARGLHPMVLKSQLTGPTTLGLILKDENNKALLYRDQIMDVLVKVTIMKARSLVSVMNEVSDVPIVFFDEPMLQSIGSAAISIDRESAVAQLREIAEEVDCLTGGHCCGNTDWSILIDAGLDIIAFDAWNFAHTIACYPEQVRQLVERDGILAWGIVPASAEGAQIDNDVLFEKLNNGLKQVSDACSLSVEKLLDHSLITPSCGLGSLTESQAETILEKTAHISSRLIDRA